MDYGNRQRWNRREFFRKFTLVGTAGLFGLKPWVSAAEPPPETTTLRLDQTGAICIAPQFVAEELLRGEGFTEVHYVKTGGGAGSAKAMASGALDIGTTNVWTILTEIDAGAPMVVLAGLHIGCFELFGQAHIRSIRDLQGKRVAVTALGSGRHLFLASMATYVGLDPRQDLHWVTDPPAVAMRLFAAGQVDAFMGFPPEPQALRVQQIGHVVVNTTLDRPWSQYFCCMVTGSREFVRTHPVATKRALRALFKGNQICAQEPERVARFLVDKGYTQEYADALQTIQEIPYGAWREYNPEDTIRFYALRLHEAGMIKSSPQKIIAQSTDWRFLNELKRELKG
jgi:NitT/TauT family transport system substrate-binding protein